MEYLSNLGTSVITHVCVCVRVRACVHMCTHVRVCLCMQACTNPWGVVSC